MADSKPLTDALRQLLAEGFRGKDAGTTWFVDGEGLLDTVAAVDARQASSAPATGGTTIAGHVEHVRWFLALLNAFARGERPEIDWAQSWTVAEVDEDQWPNLIDAAEREFEELMEHFGEGIDPDDAERLMPSLATVVHVGYHVGALRQMVKTVRAT